MSPVTALSDAQGIQQMAQHNQKYSGAI